MTDDSRDIVIPWHVAREVLNLPMQRNDAEAATVGDYLTALLSDLWRWGEDFNCKRPFGNSSWQYELYEALVRGSLIEGVFDEDGYLESVASESGDRLIQAAIKEMGKG